MKLVLSFVALLLTGACHRNQQAEGPLERAGKHLDNAGEKTGRALKGAAEKTGEGVEKAAHATGNALEKAGDKLRGKGPDSSGAQPAAAPEKKPN
jgi:hypothetical protein